MYLLFDGDLAARDTLRFVEEKTGAGLWSLDVKTGSMRWSRGLYQLFDMEPGSVEPTLALFRNMMHPDDKLSRGDFDRIVREGVSIDREFRIIRRDGRIRWVVNRGEPVLNGQGFAERAIGIVCDVTHKQNAVRELRATEQRYRALTKSVSTIVWTTPADGQAADMPEWRELTGQSMAELQGDGWLNAVHPEDRAFVAEAWSQSIAQATTYNVTYRVRLNDGTYRWFNARAAPVLSPDGQVKEWIGILINVFEAYAPLDDGRWLTGAQARAARAILNWTVKDVADATKVSVSTIRRLEESDGPSNLRGDIASAIRAAFEKYGIEFVFLPSGPPAVRPRRSAP
jgi:PAS domain S-box-containing protein